MPFNNLAQDTVSLIKQDGTVVDGIKASVQDDMIFIQGNAPVIEPGDRIQRKMSNGAEETFEVIDPGFHEKILGVGAHYQMRVRKLGIREAHTASQNISTYNIMGNNARINQNSIDQSINMVELPPDVAEKLNALRKEIGRVVEDGPKRDAALDVVDAIEEQFSSGSPKTGVVRALIGSLPDVAAIASIASFLLSLLS